MNLDQGEDRPIVAPDNPPLSPVTQMSVPAVRPVAFVPADEADDPLLEAALAKAQAYLSAAKAPNTLKAVASDWRIFAAWCDRHDRIALPADPATIALFIADEAGARRPATLRRRLASIARVHRSSGWEPPTGDQLVRDVLAGVRRTHGTTQRQRPPLTVEGLRVICDGLGDTPAEIRDRALLTLGLGSGLRREPLRQLDLTDVVIDRHRLEVFVRADKTDRDRAGRLVFVPAGEVTTTCPVWAMTAWGELLGRRDGPIFVAVTRGGTITDRRLSGDAISAIVRRRATAAGLPDAAEMSAHSMRAGLVTSAHQAGVSEADISQQSGHKDLRVLRQYVRLAAEAGEAAARAIGL
jgi:integrase